MLALTYPWIITVCFLAAIIIALKKHFWIAGGLVVVGFLLNWLSECFAFSLMSNNEMCGKRTVRVMAWNIDGSEYDSLKVSRIADVINKYKPDVVFLSEDFDKTGICLDSLLKKNYPYSSNMVCSGHQFYSNYMLDSIRVVDVEGYDNPLRIHVSIMVKGQIIDIYGCHLASNNYSASQDVGGSPALRAFKAAGFQDAWWKGGMGYGATIQYLLPYRIDHIMYNDKLTLKSIRKIDAKGLSDHDALVAEFRI